MQDALFLLGLASMATLMALAACRAFKSPRRSTVYCGGMNVAQQFLDALGITRPVTSLSIHVRLNDAVRIEVEHLMEKDQAEALTEVLQLYRAEPVAEGGAA
jgi:hypothetical protein